MSSLDPVILNEVKLTQKAIDGLTGSSHPPIGFGAFLLAQPSGISPTFLPLLSYPEPALLGNMCVAKSNVPAGIVWQQVGRTQVASQSTFHRCQLNGGV